MPDHRSVNRSLAEFIKCSLVLAESVRVHVGDLEDEDPNKYSVAGQWDGLRMYVPVFLFSPKELLDSKMVRPV
jgi:hypothetical protein